MKGREEGVEEICLLLQRDSENLGFFKCFCWILRRDFEDTFGDVKNIIFYIEARNLM